MSTISTTAPLRDLILVQLDKPDTVSTGGIIIPDSVKRERPDRGVVLRVGPDAHELSPGDVVFFRKGSGLPHPNDILCRFLEEVEVLAVHREKAAPPPDVIDWVVATCYVGDAGIEPATIDGMALHRLDEAITPAGVDAMAIPSDGEP